MPSVIESAKKIYRGEGALTNHIYFFTISMLIGAVFLLLEPKSPSAMIATYAISFLFSGYFLVLINDYLVSRSPELHDLDLNTITTAIKAIPIYLITIFITIVFSFLFALIPIIGPIIGGILLSLVTSLMFLKYCEKFNLSDALDFKTIKRLIKPLFVPYLLLGLKLFLIALIAFVPLILLSAMFLKHNYFIPITAIAYFFIIFYIIYFDNLAQIYEEIKVENLYDE